jgi:hypothetical protein
MIKDFRCKWRKRKKREKEIERDRAFLKGRETSTVGLLFQIFFPSWLSFVCFPSQNALMSEEKSSRDILE